MRNPSQNQENERLLIIFTFILKLLALIYLLLYVVDLTPVTQRHISEVLAGFVAGSFVAAK